MPLEPPPTDRTFHTRDDLNAFLKQWSTEHGYVIRIARSNKRNHTINYCCKRGGNKYVDRSTGQRKAHTLKTECPFALKAKIYFGEDAYRLQVVNPTHNHEPGIPLPVKQSRMRKGNVGAGRGSAPDRRRRPNKKTRADAGAVDGGGAAFAPVGGAALGTEGEEADEVDEEEEEEEGEDGEEEDGEEEEGVDNEDDLGHHVGRVTDEMILGMEAVAAAVGQLDPVSAAAAVPTYGPVPVPGQALAAAPVAPVRFPDSFDLYDLRVEVVCPPGERILCGAKRGDYFSMRGEMIYLPAGQGVSAYSLASILPLLAAKQRMTDPNDWMSTDALVACPDPNCKSQWKIIRTGTRAFRHADTTAVGLGGNG